MDFHLAYTRPHDGAISNAFVNDPFFAFASTEPFIHSHELSRADVSESEGQAWLSVVIVRKARDRLNSLAARNAQAIDDSDFDSVIGLAFSVDARLDQVIQGVHSQLLTNVLRWTPADDRLPIQQQLEVARKLASNINGLKP